MTSDALEIARGYTLAGWRVIPLHFGQKRPAAGLAWQELRLEVADLPRYFNGKPTNIGVLLGDPSNGLVDVDLDTLEANDLAPEFLPTTPTRFGRAARPLSHYFYIAPGLKPERFTDIRVDIVDGRRSTATLLELRSTGEQTMAPGSTHPCGEVVEWAADMPDAELRDLVPKVDAAELRAAVVRLAVAAQLVRLGWTRDMAIAQARGTFETMTGEVGDHFRRWVGISKAEPKTSTKKTAAPTFAEAVTNWNADHSRKIPRSGGMCPICGHRDCFGQLPESWDRWTCHSTSHPIDAGLRGKDVMHGDVLDIEAHERRLDRRGVLIADGYLEEHSAKDRNDNDSPPADDPGDPSPGETRTARAESTIARAWEALPPTFLTEVPPNRRWLLRHPTRDGKTCAPCTGDGLLPLGKVGLLASAGGAGKTHALVALAVSIATGKPWLGHFEVDYPARRGRIFLGLAEEDAEEVHRRLFAAAEAAELTAEQRQGVARQIVALPLAGRPVSLVAHMLDGRAIVETEELRDLRRKLTEDAGAHGWSLVALDPLARFAGPDVEADNSVATRFVQAVETLVNVPGNPTVLIAHHSSKISRRTGAVDARGVTALTDGMRWFASLRSEGKNVLFLQEKSNYSRPMLDGLRLVRGPGGLLRVPTELEEQDRALKDEARDREQNAAKDARRMARVADAEAALLEALRACRTEITSQSQLKALVPGENGIKAEAVTRLIASGRITRAKPSAKGEKGRYEVA